MNLQTLEHALKNCKKREETEFTCEQCDSNYLCSLFKGFFGMKLSELYNMLKWSRLLGIESKEIDLSKLTCSGSSHCSHSTYEYGLKVDTTPPKIDNYKAIDSIFCSNPCMCCATKTPHPNCPFIKAEKPFPSNCILFSGK
jgi:hypothetical protein